MIPFEIGNWTITEKGITHKNNPDYLIDIDSLAEAGTDGRETIYDWLVHLPTKTWVSTEDVYTFNTAMMFALEYFDIQSDLSFVDTFIEQQRELMAYPKSQG